MGLFNWGVRQLTGGKAALSELSLSKRELVILCKRKIVSLDQTAGSCKEKTGSKLGPMTQTYLPHSPVQLSHARIHEAGLNANESVENDIFNDVIVDRLCWHNRGIADQHLTLTLGWPVTTCFKGTTSTRPLTIRPLTTCPLTTRSPLVTPHRGVPWACPLVKA